MKEYSCRARTQSSDEGTAGFGVSETEMRLRMWKRQESAAAIREKNYCWSNADRNSKRNRKKHVLSPSSLLSFLCSLSRIKEGAGSLRARKWSVKGWVWAKKQLVTKAVHPPF